MGLLTYSNLWMFLPFETFKTSYIPLICNLLVQYLQYLESMLHALLVAMSGKPRASFQVVKNNLC